MSDIIKLREVSLQFRRISSDFLQTTDNDNMTYVKRLYSYLNQEEIIKNFIDQAMSASEYDCNQFVTENNNLRHQYKINIPENELDHIKAMYDFLSDLATNAEYTSLHGIAFSFDRSKKSFNEAIRSFLEMTFKPLINFITDSLSKEMIKLEQNKSPIQFTQNIEKNYGTANVGEEIMSINNVSLQSNLEEFFALISIFKEEIEQCQIDEDEKVSALDDLSMIKEQYESHSPNLTRTQKAINGIKKFMENVSASTVASIAAPKLIEIGTQVIQMLEQIYS